jgi:predicted enzyme related to lactoylglutathione lyase
MGNSSGRFVWYELATADIENAKAFYAGVMGWRTADALMPGSAYSVFAAGDTPVAGLMKLPEDARKTGAVPQWTGYVGVDDVDIAAGRVKQLGGTVQIPPSDVPNVSRFSVIADPHMATLALVQGRAPGYGRTAQLGAPGHVGWHALLASDWESAFAFYSQLLGWQKTDANVSSMGTYQLFSAGVETIGGMCTWPEKSPYSLWLYYFNAGGIEAAAKRVEAGGGQILYGPIAVPGGARVVHCTDPQGVIFGLIDWRVRVAVGCYAARAASNTPGRRRPK